MNFGTCEWGGRCSLWMFSVPPTSLRRSSGSLCSTLLQHPMIFEIQMKE
jgi:hypothetical protein